MTRSNFSHTRTHQHSNACSAQHATYVRVYYYSLPDYGRSRARLTGEILAWPLILVGLQSCSYEICAPERRAIVVYSLIETGDVVCGVRIVLKKFRAAYHAKMRAIYWSTRTDGVAVFVVMRSGQVVVVVAVVAPSSAVAHSRLFIEIAM